MKIDIQQHNDICNAVEKATLRKMQTPRDFNYLALRIYDSTRAQLSISTLKRFWGYVENKNSDEGDVRLSTLDILARYVGYSDWKAFVNRNHGEGEESGSDIFYGSRVINASDIRVGELIQVIWRPDRCITLRCSGSGVFLVTKSQNSKLSVGDTFTCPIFVEHQPLELTNLIHNGGNPCGFICGKNGGVTLHYPLVIGD